MDYRFSFGGGGNGTAMDLSGPGYMHLQTWIIDFHLAVEVMAQQ